MRMLCALAMLTGCALANAQTGPLRATRSSALTGAKNLTVTTTSGTVYYYLVSSNDSQMMHLSEDSLHIAGDRFAKAKIRGMRFRSLPRRLMDEDSLTYDKTQTLDHGLLALRRDFAIGEWNSLVLPVELTGQQLRDAFGEDAQVATVRGVNEEDQTVIEFQTVDLQTDATVTKANYHYLIRPTKEPDVAATSGVSGFASSRVKGPIYLFPNVSVKANQSPRSQLVKSGDEQTQVRLRGTYTLLDGSTTKNKKIPGAYAWDDESHQFAFNEDSVIVRAFRSWVLDLSADARPLKFYVDGVELTDGIEDLTGTPWQTTGRKENEAYDLSGRRVANPTRKGIYIINGKKTFIK